MNILITGGTGYIGRNLVEAFLSKGDKVFLIRRETSINNIQHENLVEIIYDETYSSFEKIKEKIDIVYHLATCFLVNHKTENLEELINSNILFGTQLLEYMAKHSIQNFINTETYAESITGEEYNPQNLYSATKMAFKSILKYYVDTYNMKAISLVLSDTYGPNDTRKKFLNLVLDALKSQDLNFKMSLGEQEICYIYIEDVVNAYLKSRDLISSQGIKELKTYSVFGNEILTLNNLVELLEKIFNKKLSTEKGYYPYRLREIMKFNYAHIERLPNWEPKISLKEGVKRI